MLQILQKTLECFFNKVSGLQACNFIIKRLKHRSFPVKFVKFLRTHFFKEQLQWLLLAVPIILHNKCILYLKTYANDDNFINWLALKVFIIYNTKGKQC